MNYHLSDHIYITQFREEVILLDVKKDNYTIFFKEFSILLMNVLNKEILCSKNPFIVVPGFDNTQQQSSYIQKLLDDDIINAQESPYPFYIDQKPYSEGVANVDWRLPLNNKKVKFNIHVLSAFLTLIKVNLYMKYNGLYSAIHLIRKYHNPKLEYITPKGEELHSLANIVNKACLMYPSRTKCLEWAMTFVLMALKRRWKCNLEIGVQNYPFFAHAWVECGGKVVMDSQDLRKGLGIILNEPFRRIK